MEHYLDNAATTAVCSEAAAAALDAMTNIYGNPSSTHTKGRQAKKLLDSSRKTLADALGAKSDEIVFTSCGSESDNWAVLGGADLMKRQGRHIITSKVEHDAIRRSCEKLESMGYEVTYLDPDPTGRICAESVADALRDDTILVSLMMVNNETGAVTDIKSVSDVLKKAGSKALLHTDAVQAFMKVPFKAKTLGADLISVSAHKIHAPKGIGLLYIQNGVKLKPFIVGGSQENSRRAGTEALPQIAAFAAACSLGSAASYMSEKKNELTQKLVSSIPDIRYIETDSPHILSISLPGYRSEVLMNFLEAREIYVSKSSACKLGKRSHVLEAIGLPADVIDGSLRIGLSRYTTSDDIDALVSSLAEAKNTLAHR